ncbi:hypothetical protein RRSWK_02960 [Rhodopirellula sp. SWK7]|nr:hypothetical protein RRSWK_02960 [Rhodopirellula sp. SWK7]
MLESVASDKSISNNDVPNHSRWIRQKSDLRSMARSLWIVL